MYHHQTYRVNKQAINNAVQQDQSYKNCLGILLVFFFLCFILILACVAWKSRSQGRYNNSENGTHEVTSLSREPHKQYQHGENTKAPIPITNTVSTTELDIGIIEDKDNYPDGLGDYPEEATDTDEENGKIKSIATSSTERVFRPDNESYGEESGKGMEQSTRQSEKDKSTTEETRTRVTYQWIDKMPLISQPHEPVTTDEYSLTRSTGITEDATASSTDEYDMTSAASTTIENAVSSSDDLTTTVENTSGTRDILKTDVVSSTMISIIGLEENASPEYSSVGYYSQETQSVPTIIYHTAETATATTGLDPEENVHAKYSTENYSSTEQQFTTTRYDDTESENTASISTEATSQDETTETLDDEESSTHVYLRSTSYTSTTPGTVTTLSTSHSTITPLLPDEENDVCETEHCKRTASKMLSYMNHMADPCDDFYEYACGGFEANPQLVDADLVRQSKIYERIGKQMAKEKREGTSSTFATYYDSCVKYERTVNFNERVEMAINALKDMGKFYVHDPAPDNDIDFTDLFVRLMLHHSALLFDVVPTFDEFHPHNFTLQISLPKYESPFMTGHQDDLCSEDEFETENQYMELNVLYANYKTCNKNTEEFLRSVKEALTIFDVFKGLSDDHLKPDYIKKTVDDVNVIIMQGYFSYFPSKDEIQQVYMTNTYDKISFNGWRDTRLVNWTQLIPSLIGEDVMDTSSIKKDDIRIYFYDALMSGLFNLEKFAESHQMRLNNAIMALYAHKLYHELVLSKHDNVKDYCLRVATNLLRLEASSLYISSFSDAEIKKMNELIKSSFNDLKQTLKNKTQQVKWTNESGRETLLEKVNSLKLSLPAFSYYRNRDSLYSDYNMPQVALYDNYFNNSMTLLKRHRTLMYNVLKRQTEEDREVFFCSWMHYATPFQSKGRVIYDLNLVVIPYGIFDWSSINNDHTLNYIILATLGNLIAYQIAHHFNMKGVHYGILNKNVVYEEDTTVMNLVDYIKCHKNNLYQIPMNFTLPLTEQTVSFTIPELTLNERLSDIVGFRLAYDTLALTRSNAEKRLPWIKLRIEQLFYLAYAQMYCTKSPLTSSYVSLYESEDLPNRIRVFVSTSNNKFVAEAWNCPIGSQIAPNNVCGVFPCIDPKETEQAPV